MTTDKRDTEPAPNRRGRKPGFMLHPRDRNHLLTAARLLNTGHAASARQAFLRITSHDETAVRRLQRRWEKDGVAILYRDRVAHRERCEIEYRGLRSAHPKPWARIFEFVASPAGRRHLQQYVRADGEPIHPMALGLANLTEAMDRAEASSRVATSDTSRTRDRRCASDGEVHNSIATQRRFDHALDAWFEGGVPATAQNLRALAQRVDRLADGLEEEDVDAVDTNAVPGEFS